MGEVRPVKMSKTPCFSFLRIADENESGECHQSQVIFITWGHKPTLICEQRGDINKLVGGERQA